MSRSRPLRTVIPVLVAATVILASAAATALIISSPGNTPVHDMGWPGGILALANLEERLEYWEGPPFGGGEYHFGYRADSTEDLNRALEMFAAVQAPVRELVVHETQRPQGMAVDEPLDWTLTVWVYENWHRLHHAPRPRFLTEPSQGVVVGTPAPAPRIDLYLGEGNAVEWEKIRIPGGITVVATRFGAQAATAGGPAAVAGIIYDLSTAKPVAGATVSLEPVGEGRSDRVVTTETGAFRFDSLSTAYYRLSIAADGYASRTIHLDCLTPDSCLNSRIGIAAASQLSGRVVDHEGQPVPGVIVSALTLMAIDLSPYLCPDVQPTTTDGDGRFALERLPTGYAELKLKRPGARLFGETTSLLAVPSSRARLQLQALGTIEGVVPEDRRGDGQVHVYPATGEVYGFAYTANCAKDGSFTIENVPPGEYRVGTDMMEISGHGDDDTGVTFILVPPGKTVQPHFAP